MVGMVPIVADRFMVLDLAHTEAAALVAHVLEVWVSVDSSLVSWQCVGIIRLATFG